MASAMHMRKIELKVTPSAIASFLDLCFPIKKNNFFLFKWEEKEIDGLKPEEGVLERYQVTILERRKEGLE
jgi:hypothetical protein